MLPPLPLASRAPRRLVTRSGARVRGFKLAVPNSKKVAWESPYEASAISILSLNKSVQRIFSQPLVLEVDGTHYTPDLLVFLKNGRRVWIECKSDKDVLDEETKRKLALVNAIFRGVGDRFVVLDAKDLDPASSFVDNCRYLALWLDIASPDFALPLEQGTYGELLKRYGADRVNAALAAGTCRFDLTKPLAIDTVVSPGREGGAHELAFLQT